MVARKVTNGATNADAIAVLLVAGTLFVGACLIIAGVVLFFVFLKKIKFDVPEYEAEGENVTSLIWKNGFMIAAVAIMCAVFAISLL